ncbi:MAG: peptide ABC transporter substrate-binding protein [Acidobacteria bacterium]|nr:MAG: peptide ABC transporter substrate-binding protein [Acidobacteriota bacterium]
MNKIYLCFISLSLLMFNLACSESTASRRYWGKTEPPKENMLRYVSGSEPESLDPQIPTGQPEARILMALYDGLVEYHPKTMAPIPAIAERWEISPDGTEFIFYLRRNARFSNGDPITAYDFVYTFRRGLDPELAAQNSYLAYEIKYAKAYNSREAFVRKENGEFLLRKDFETDLKEVNSAGLGPDTEFHRFINSPERLTVPLDEKDRQELIDKNPKLKEAIDGKELVPVRAEDIGVEAIDDYTLRLKLAIPAPYFLDLLPHQFFRVVNKKVIEKYGKEWTRPENIVTSGAFKLLTHRPYDVLVVVKNQDYWDAENVSLDRIEFYPLEEQSTMMNMYKAGAVDATYNHTVPASWLDEIRQYKDEYLDHPEVTIEYYTFNVRRKPMDDVRVRKAFALAIDRFSLAKFRKTSKPLVDFTPEGIFPKYEEIRKRVYEQLLRESGISKQDWEKRHFDPERACRLMKEAGYQVENKPNGRCEVKNFPIGEVALTYNTSESNKAVAEFIQAQWKQNLGITIPLRNMEWKTFLPTRKKLDYTGMTRAGWVGDYMDPNTFLKLFYGSDNDSGTGWYDPKFDKLLDQANSEVNPEKRFELMARAEFYMLQSQPVIPLMTASTNWLKKPYVKGLYPNPGTLHAWKFVYIERDPNKWDRDVDNIMNESDPIVEEKLARLQRSQIEFEKQRHGE